MFQPIPKSEVGIWLSLSKYRCAHARQSILIGTLISLGKSSYHLNNSMIFFVFNETGLTLGALPIDAFDIEQIYKAAL